MTKTVVMMVATLSMMMTTMIMMPKAHSTRPCGFLPMPPRAARARPACEAAGAQPPNAGPATMQLQGAPV